MPGAYHSPKKRRDAFRNILIPVRPLIGVIEKMNIGESILRKNEAMVHIVGATSSSNPNGFNAVKNSVSALRAWLTRENVKNSYELHLGENIVSDIVQACRDITADLIVITASTKRNLLIFVIGNFTQKIINNRNAAVLCVKEG